MSIVLDPDAGDITGLTAPLAVGSGVAAGDAVNLGQNRGLFIGTVSQSGGVATGAVIETGSNANGYYTKFADGTMICRLILAASNNVATGEGSIFTTASTVWTFPVAFTTVAPAVCVTEGSGVGSCWGSLGTASTTLTNTSFQIKRAASVAAVPSAALIAVGRWF